ncbi:MAG: TetR/AcrR family transcriptional regulator, partial [Salibacteraceae bacterium]
EVSPDLYVKNPDNSELGKKIVTNSIELIHELGFETFTIKKLSSQIGSPESTIYRYFESKHMILFYLIYWYWSWIEYRLVFKTNNLTNSEEKLKSAISLLTESVKEDSTFSHVNEILLDRIIMSEAVKAYFTKRIDLKTKQTHFSVYQKVVERVSQMVLEINANFKYSHMLVSTIIEGAHQQRFFAENIPSLTDVTAEPNYITKFYEQLVFNSISK